MRRQRQLVVLTIFTAALFGRSEACSSTAAGAFREILGSDATVGKALPYRTGNEAAIALSRDLTCTQWGTTCRWRNERNGVGERAIDNLDWATGGGTWDRIRAQTAFNLPRDANPFGTDGEYAVTGSNDNKAIALLVSDPIPCQASEGYLTFSFWTTQNAYVRVCTRLPNNGRNYLYCGPKVSLGDPGPVQMTVPGPIGQPFELILEASGFNANIQGFKGGIVVIDDITYIAQGIGQCNFGNVNRDNNAGFG